MYFDEDIKLFEFKNDSHFNNHLDYLMRTDKVQKWTNEYTSKNESFTLGDPTDTGIFQFKLDTRKSLKENFYKQWKQDVNHLYFARVECPRDDIFDWNADMHKEMQMSIPLIKYPTTLFRHIFFKITQTFGKCISRFLRISPSFLHCS